MTTLFAYGLPSLLMVALALTVALAGFLQYRLVAKLAPDARLVCVFLVIGAGALLSVALTNRTLDEARLSAGLVVSYDDMASGFAASRWLSLFLVAASLIEVLRGWANSLYSKQRDPALPLLLALLLFYFGTMGVQGFLSDEPDFSYRTFYVPLVLVGAFYQRPDSLRRVFLAAKWALLAVTVGSLIAIFVRPDFALNRPVPSLIPGINWRLFGLTPHANGLGPIAVLAIVIELQHPFKSRFLRWLSLTAAFTVLVLTQSKTAWAAGVVILLVVWCPLALRRAFNAASAVQQFNRAVWSTVGVIALLILSGGALVAFDVIDKLLSKTDLMTLTGRTEIWTITLEAWKDNPLFGFGPGVWGAERQQRFQMFHVGHAHNQIVQSLGEAGLVGLLFLCSYLGVLLYAAMRRFEVSRGVVLTLLMLVAVRCVTEAPLSRSSLLSWDMFLHALLMVTACHHLRTRGQAVPHAHSQPYPTALAPQPCRATSPSARSRWFQADATPSFALSSYGFARRSSTERPAL